MTTESPAPRRPSNNSRQTHPVEPIVFPRFNGSYVEQCADALSRSTPQGVPAVFHMMEKGVGGFSTLQKFIASSASSEKADVLVQSQLAAWLALVLTSPARTATVFKGAERAVKARAALPSTVFELYQACTDEVREIVDQYFSFFLLPAAARVRNQPKYLDALRTLPEAQKMAERQRQTKEVREALLSHSAGLLYDNAYPMQVGTSDNHSVTAQAQAQLLEVQHQKGVALVLKGVTTMLQHLVEPAKAPHPFEGTLECTSALLQELRQAMTAYLEHRPHVPLPSAILKDVPDARPAASAAAASNRRRTTK